jgi:hypothetical protein
MVENPRRTGRPLDTNLPLPSEYAIGSVESRAAARALLESKDTLPNLSFVFVAPGPRDGNGKMLIPGGIRCDTHRATCSGKVFTRNDGETREEFEARVHDSLPIRTDGCNLIFFEPDPDWKRKSLEITSEASPGS